MASVKYIKSAAEIPVREKYVLVQYGAARETIRHSRGTIIILPDRAPGLKPEDLTAAMSEANRIADENGLSIVYVVDRRAHSRTKPDPWAMELALAVSKHGALYHAALNCAGSSTDAPRADLAVGDDNATALMPAGRNH